MKKIVLCIPRGCGLNDILCRVGFSLEYCQKYNRTLIIDTRIAGLWDDFSNYFIKNNDDLDIIERADNQTLKQLNLLSCYPNERQGKIEFIYYDFYCNQKTNHIKNSFIRKTTLFLELFRLYISVPNTSIYQKLLLIFDSIKFKKSKNILANNDSCDADVILHHQSGGGVTSLNTLKFFKFTKDLKEHLLEKMQECGDDYFAIHVRNTDYKSNYKAYFDTIKDIVAGKKLLICSDDVEAINYAKFFFDTADVFSFSHIEKRDGKPLHKSSWNKTPDEKKRINYDMFVDLVCLANAQKLFIIPLLEGNYLSFEVPKGSFSGFSLLAKGLHENKDILSALLSE
ncbi:hypothetical protein EMA8858_04055 [Emticicia aquatica]|uniref:Uncharacterized protein n=1 Tax=Emticicia aquatica TaxID=1681835 RepID=A0ABM9AWM5_9BACT|nr:hypothetical protein [Emticicia aquatica]CAH0997920.1 hypothetical protein EMA8858_04055 [Emticicia aquatica]